MRWSAGDMGAFPRITSSLSGRSRPDKEEDVEPLQEDGVNREEVGGDDRGGVGGKEAAPGERGATSAGGMRC